MCRNQCQIHITQYIKHYTIKDSPYKHRHFRAQKRHFSRMALPSSDSTFDEMIQKPGIAGDYHNTHRAEPLNVILRRPESFKRALELLRDPNATRTTLRNIRNLFTPDAYGKNMTFQQAVGDSLELVNDLMDFILDPEISEKRRVLGVYILGTLFVDYGRVVSTVRESDFYVRLMRIYDVSPSCFAEVLQSPLFLIPFKQLYFLWGCLLSLARETKTMDVETVPAWWSSELTPEPGCITKFRDQDINPAAFASILEVLVKDHSPSGRDTETDPECLTDFFEIVRQQAVTIVLHYIELKSLESRGQSTEDECSVTLRSLVNLKLRSTPALFKFIHGLIATSPFIGSPLNHMCIRCIADLMTKEFLEEYFSFVVDTIRAQFYIKEDWEQGVYEMLAQNEDPWLLWSLRCSLPNQFGRSEAIALAKSVVALNTETAKVDDFRKSMVALIATCWVPSSTRVFKTQLIALAHEIGKSNYDAKYDQFFDEIVTPFYECLYSDERNPRATTEEKKAPFSFTDFSFDGCPLIDPGPIESSWNTFLQPYFDFLGSLPEE